MMASIISVIEQVCMHTPLILGAYISFSLLKVPDLSLESAYLFGAICSAQIMVVTQSIPLSAALILTVTASLIGGIIVGLVSSLLTTKARFPHLLSSIITFGLFHGVNQVVSKSYLSLSGLHNVLQLFSVTSTHPEFIMLGFFAVFFCVVVYFLLQTQLGYSFGIYGNNNNFFSNYGISNSFVFIVGILISNALSGLSGFLVAQSIGFVEHNMALGKALMCISALILGKSLIKPNKPIMLAIPILGLMSYFCLQQLLLNIGFDLKYFTMIQSSIILGILIYQFKHKKQSIDHLGV